MIDEERNFGHQIPEIDRLIHEPARYHIMALLYVVESADFIFIKNQIQLTAGNLSSHLGKLETAGYLEVTKEFVNRKPRTMLNLTETGREAFRKYSQQMKQMFKDLPQ
jgi:DNA-binding MarR family transcriptional regulator